MVQSESAETCRRSFQVQWWPTAGGPLLNIEARKMLLCSFFLFSSLNSEE